MSKKAKAFAKINLFLDVIGKRPDGYHELDSVFQSVSLYDEIYLNLTDNGISVICNNDELSGEENIVYKACELFLKEINYGGGVSVRIVKNIPIAAGMGGGSADAAATLRLLNDAFGHPFTAKRLCDLALKLGADVPFCVVGGTARVKGIGEEISPISSPTLHYVILKEKEKQSTGKMFAVIDETEYVTKSSIDELEYALKKDDKQKVAECLFNAFSFCWDFEQMTAPFKEFYPLGVFLSGSGPTVCALFKDMNEAQLCANALRNKGLNAFYACSMPVGVEIE